MKIAFFGTPDFAVPTLQKLAASGHTVEVFTQPDRPVGRKAVLTPSAVKAEAIKLGLPVHQFEKISAPEGVAAIRAFAPDLFCVVAFGQLFSEEVLAIPPYGAVNVHGSVLPKYRGASPVQQTVIDGCAEAGVSTMLLVKKMDAGDILEVKTTPLGPNETFGELFDRLSVLGADLFMETLALLEAGKLVRHPQQEEEATYCAKLSRDSGRIDFSCPAASVHNLIRGTDPWPGAYAMLNGEKLKIWRSDTETGTMELPAENGSILPGTLILCGKDGLAVRCGDAWLRLLELQLPGGKRLAVRDFLRGHDLTGQILS